MTTELPTSRSRAHAGFRRIPWAEYMKHPALSRSVLDKIRTSPLHLQHYLVHGGEDSPAMVLGRVFHALVEAKLTGKMSTFEEKVAVWRNGDRRGNAWKDFEALHAARDIVKVDEMERIERMVDAVLTSPKSRGKLDGASIESAAFWTDPSTGVECKGLIDVIREDALYDLKTTADIEAESFGKGAFSWGYHRQAAWYLDGAGIAANSAYSTFGLIVVEKEAPFAVRVLHFDDDAIMRGRAENRANLNFYAACKLGNSWPGPGGDSIETLSLPRWA